MNYAEALHYLDGFVNYERGMPNAAERGAFDLSRIRELAARLGDPHLRCPALHVAGTKGKGSVCAFADAILRAAGLRTGLYTSPHLVEVRERVRVNGEKIPEPDFARLLERCIPHLEEMRARPKGTRPPTYFEVLTHLAFLYFAEQGVEAAVFEVGLGGRLDATNIVCPDACGIAHISFDHMAILGNTLAAIAGEKAGILKRGVPCVTAAQEPEAAAAIEAAARTVGAPLEFIGRDGSLTVAYEAARSAEAPLPRPAVTLRGPSGEMVRAELGLAGRHQAENWAVAVRLAQLFHRGRRGTALPDAAIATGSRGVEWPGRLEEAPRAAGGPRLFLDGAHNAHSVATVLAELRALLPGRRPLVVLFACAQDKDVPALLVRLARLADAVVFTHSGHPRGVAPAVLAAGWKTLTGREAAACERLSDGLSAAGRLAGASGTVLVTGSLYLVGAVLTSSPSSPASSRKIPS